MRHTVLLSFAAAVVVFCVVQDRVTAAGARRYVAQHRLAVDAGRAPASVAGVMQPAIRQSVVGGLTWGGLAFATGVGGGALIRGRHRE